ncbi:hypothetical protein [Aromatoleum aromaticum]|uniref:hypothetical protein n=1 Tax=Aromatoleum aromaticum TaxID=551760 RepID=UPI0012FEB997|nr:hypothetical protein [Aromatoleum aromaticum]NMG55457.1 hypothetical protein [Aromatoleum aromaticum]
MTENLRIIHKKLGYLARMQADLQHSTGKMASPLRKIQLGDIAGMTPDERETVSAFTTRFAAYQEQIGKTMRSIAIEEESATRPEIIHLSRSLGRGRIRMLARCKFRGAGECHAEIAAPCRCRAGPGVRTGGVCSPAQFHYG